MLPLLSSLTSWSTFSSAFSAAVSTSCPICLLVIRLWMAKAVGLSFLLCSFITYFWVDSAFGALLLASAFFSAFSSFWCGGSPVGKGDPFTVSRTSCDCGHQRFRKQFWKYKFCSSFEIQHRTEDAVTRRNRSPRRSQGLCAKPGQMEVALAIYSKFTPQWQTTSWTRVLVALTTKPNE